MTTLTESSIHGARRAWVVLSLSLPWNAGYTHSFTSPETLPVQPHRMLSRAAANDEAIVPLFSSLAGLELNVKNPAIASHTLRPEALFRSQVSKLERALLQGGSADALRGW
jgi:hypothetical protein